MVPMWAVATMVADVAVSERVHGALMVTMVGATVYGVLRRAMSVDNRLCGS